MENKTIINNNEIEVEDINNIVNPEVRKATDDIIGVTKTSINCSGINKSYVNNNSFEDMIVGLRTDVTRLKKELVKSSIYDNDNKDKEIELEIDLLLKDIVIDVICIQIKRGKMGIEY